MKQIPCIFFFISCFFSVYGQTNADYGIFGGVSSYMGDINPGRLMYSPLPAAGVLYRYNFHPRQAVRANIFYGGLRGSDMDFSSNFQTARDSSFSGAVGEFAVQFEFNFLPYTTRGRLWDFTPYFAAGAGMAQVKTNTASGIQINSFQPVIPFSVGFKINIHKNMGLETEYGFRKTFYDNFDGLNDLVAQEDQGVIHNNDWYSFVGIVLTWKIYNRLAGCPAYADVDSKSKR